MNTRGVAVADGGSGVRGLQDDGAGAGETDVRRRHGVSAKAHGGRGSQGQFRQEPGRRAAADAGTGHDEHGRRARAATASAGSTASWSPPARPSSTSMSTAARTASGSGPRAANSPSSSRRASRSISNTGSRPPRSIPSRGRWCRRPPGRRPCERRCTCRTTPTLCSMSASIARCASSTVLRPSRCSG